MPRLFLSHAWAVDEKGRNNHARVRRVKRALEARGYETWFDDDRIGGNLEHSVADGIETSDAVVVFLTRTYCEKINAAARDPHIRDWCAAEWTYASARQKLLIPVVMDPSMRNPRDWPVGVVLLQLGSRLCADMSGDVVEDGMPQLLRSLQQASILPKAEPSHMSHLGTLASARSSSHVASAPCLVRGASSHSKSGRW